ncbi:MAG TPA: tyrosine--tRNA ligase, partial [Chitinophagales bacterium]|nr:tyrosine--tRNA ligase [Chitinophagales bacterium]
YLCRKYYAMDFLSELKWRGLFYDMVPGTDKFLAENTARGYIGFDPSSPSLGIGNLVQVMILRFFQLSGHQPVAVVGGATGMIGDPSGKSSERSLLSKEELESNKENFRKQLSKFLDFGKGGTSPILLDNYDWYRQMNVVDFLRDYGKHLTVNYMMGKESVKSRLETGISYTEFSYQLLQAYDYYWLYKHYGVRVQMGGSDQWGNITAGVELIRKLGGEEVYAVTCPLITKPDGGKFGKTEEGNIFLDAEMTSPYRFYQFWLNVSDEEAEKYIKIFTFLSHDEIDALIAEHRKAAHLRNLQKRLAREVTVMVHSERDYQAAVNASEILFGKATREMLASISEKDFLTVLEGIPVFNVPGAIFEKGIPLMEGLTAAAPVFHSKSELRRIIKEGGLSINKEKVPDEHLTLTHKDLLNDKYLLVQKGKKTYYLVVAE